MAKRSKPTDFVRGNVLPIDASYNEQAGALKVISGIVGRLVIMGDAATAKAVTKPGALVAIFNATAGVLWAKTGLAGVSSPTTGTNGVALRPMDYTIIAMPVGDTHVITSAQAWAYQLEDDSEYR